MSQVGAALFFSLESRKMNKKISLHDITVTSL